MNPIRIIITNVVVVDDDDDDDDGDGDNDTVILSFLFLRHKIAAHRGETDGQLTSRLMPQSILS